MIQTNKFYGRQDELNAILNLWKEVTKKDDSGKFVGSPKMRIIVGESGLGKSRLVHAFYDYIASENEWNPTEFQYWPKKFNKGGVQIPVNPISQNLNTDFIPTGPPKFLWLGARWQSNFERNIEERTCLIPSLRETLTTHVNITKKYLPAWIKTKAIGGKILKSYDIQDGADVNDIFSILGDTISQFIPYVNLISKAVQTTIHEIDTENRFEYELKKNQKSASKILLTELKDIFGGFGSGGFKVPLVLWFDDAHWIDSITLDFLHDFWEESNKKNWPVLFIITHWEREWNFLKQLDKNQREKSLLRYENNSIILKPSSKQSMESCIHDRLQGITKPQVNLLLKKADGNFLTLIENIGYLIQQPELFIDSDIKRPLTEKAIQRIKNWESARIKRVEQRFLELEPELKKVLGWSSQAGETFLKKVLLDIAKKYNEKEIQSIESGLNTCVDPYAILGKKSEEVFTFRDAAFFKLASDYFENILIEKNENYQIDIVRESIIENEIQLINNTFGENGECYLNKSLRNNKEINSLSDLESQERQELLISVLENYSYDTDQSWNNIKNIGLVRAVVVLVKIQSENGIYKHIPNYITHIENVDWFTVPKNIFSIEELRMFGSRLEEASEYRISEKILNVALRISEENYGLTHLRTAEILNNLGILSQTIGQYEKAKNYKRRSLKIRRLEFGEHAESIAMMEANLGWLYIELGEYQNSKDILTESLKKYEKIFGKDHKKTLLPLHNLIIALNNLEEYEQAENYGLKNLKLREKYYGVTSLEASSALTNLSNIYTNTGDIDEAIKYEKQSLKIKKQKLGENHPDTALLMNNLANSFRSKKEYQKAESLFIESLNVFEKKFGADNIRTMLPLGNLGRLYIDLNEFEKGIGLLTKNYEVKKEYWGASHRHTKSAYNALNWGKGEKKKVIQNKTYSKNNREKKRSSFFEVFIVVVVIVITIIISLMVSS